MTGRDQQRSRVYAWENRVIAPCDASRIAFTAAQGVVDAIWSEFGLRYPPLVVPLPAQARCRFADADRLTIRLPESIPSWCLLHELAHAMTTTHDGISDGHGPLFVGIYVQLVVRYLGLDQAELQHSLERDHITISQSARPVFVD
jgi:hypothetical protein